MDCYKDEYSVRKELVNGEKKYFLQFSSVAGAMPEMEINHRTYCLYAKKFSKPLKSQKYFKSTYGSNQNIEDLEDANDFALKVASTEQQYIDSLKLADVMNVIESCTLIQQRRFELHLQGLSYQDIADIDNCTKQAVHESLLSVFKKIKKII